MRSKRIPKLVIRKSPRKAKKKLKKYADEAFEDSDYEDELLTELKKEINELGVKAEADVYTCGRCLSTFSSKSSLQKHKKSHEVKGIRKTRRRIKTEDFIERYTYYFDEVQELYICNTCCAEFKDEDEAEKHTKSHEETFECSSCSERCQSLFHLGRHFKEFHAEDDSYSCPQCANVKFPKPHLFMRHIQTVHQKKFRFTCRDCGKGFHSRSLCTEHLNMHLGIKPFKCVVCGALFTYSKSVVTHQLKAHRVEILGESHRSECTFCRSRFVSIASLNRHVQQVHATPKAPKPKVHLCDYCGMGFAKKNKMVVHQRVHTGIKPYPCKYCDKCFSKSGERNCHERIHTGERPYSCSYCGKAFRQSAPFKVHIRTHTGERPYVCDLCTKGFTTNQGLKLHKQRCGGFEQA